MKSTAKITIRRVLLTGAALVPMSVAHAQTPSKSVSDASTDNMEIVVTAERRETKLQETPIAIEAYSGEALTKRGVLGVAELTSISPSLYIERSGSQGYVFIRGVGNNSVGIGADGSSSVYLDGIYLSRPASALSELFDIAQVEVLKGPQGTLYGRNATGGAILINTARPELGKTVVKGRVGYGNFDRIRTEATVNLPFGENGALRVSGLYGDDDGYRTNLLTNKGVDDRKVTALRGQLLWDIGGWSARLSGDYMNTRGSLGNSLKLDTTQPAPVVTFFGATVPADPYVDSYDSPNFARVLQWGSSFTFEGQAGPLAVKSVTSFRRTEQNRSIDLDSTAIRFGATEFGDEVSEAFTQDIQLSNAEPSAFEYIVGASYLSDELTSAIRAAVYPFGLVVENGSRNSTTSIAVFGEGKYNFNDNFALVVGGRYSHEKKTQLFNTALPNPVFDRNSWNAFTPKFGIQYQGDNALLYATVTNGFKSGGFNANAVQPPFNEEKIWSYEVGAKTDWFDNRLIANFSAFYYDYKDLQVSQVILPNPVPIIANAGTAKVYGLEVDLIARPTDRLRLTASAAYLHTEYGNLVLGNGEIVGSPLQNVNGNQFARAPKLTLTGGFDYTAPIGDSLLIFSGNANYRSRIYYTAFESPITSQGGYVLLDARIAYQTGPWELSVFGRNLTDKFYKTLVTSSPSFTGTQFLVSEPRTYGVSISYGF